MSDGTAYVRGVSLRELLPEAEFIGADDIIATSCASDSRACRPGDLFVALPPSTGLASDSAEHIADAVRRGAAAIATDHPAPDCRIPICYVTDARRALGHVCQALAGNPSQRLKVIGVTGTNGKTTTSYLIAGVLAAGGHRPGVIGTLGYDDGLERDSSPWTTPPAPVLAQWLGRMRAADCSHAVLEVSSHALTQERIAGVDLDVACITNVRHDHLDYHGTLRRYREAKTRLFEYLLPEGFAVVNADDPVAADCLSGLDGPVLSVGLDAAAEVTAQIVEQYSSEQTFLLSVEGDSIPVRTPLVGRHNVSNCLVAAAVGFAYGLDLTTVARGLESVAGVSGRLERIECGQPFGVFVDFAHTPDALSNCLETLRSAISGRLICVFGAGGNRDPHKRPLMGAAVERASDVAVLTNDNPRDESPERIARQVLDGFADSSNVRVILDRSAAIGWALGHARPGDCVLIAGKGHERSQIVGGQSFPFDDRDVARQWLHEMAPAHPLFRLSA